MSHVPKPLPAATRNASILASLAGAALTLGLLACGGGGGSSKTAATAPFTVSAPSVTLPVPAAADQAYGATPYVGTVTVSLTRASGFTGTVTLAVGSLPVGVKATFADAIIPSGSSTAVLSLQAGYPDPTDPTFATQIYPKTGTYAIPITATSGATQEAANLTLVLGAEANTFALALVDAAGQTNEDQTNLSMAPSGATTIHLEAFQNTGGFSAPYGPVTMAVQGAPPHLGVAFDTTSFYLDDNTGHALTLTPEAGLAPGLYAFAFTGTYLGKTVALPVIVSWSPAPFTLRSPSSASVYVAQGQTLKLPFYLWHDDTFFNGNATDAQGDPDYVGGTALSVTGLTAGGPQLSFPTSNINGLACAPLVVDATSATPGTYGAIGLVATRTGGSAPGSATLPLTVVVTPSGAAQPTLWIQNVEWGQTVVSPALPLVSGKPALLRVQLVADRPLVTAPAVTATIKTSGGATLDTVTLQGPGTVPMAITEGDLPTATQASGTTYTAVLKAGDLQPGITVTLQAGSLTQVVTPNVVAGSTLNLTLVPVYVQGVAPVLPATAEVATQLTAFWPVQDVAATVRAPYATSTVIPQLSGGNPLTNVTGDAWLELLNEVGVLKLVDGAPGNYYGIFNPGYQQGPTQEYGALEGISIPGAGVGIGIDVTAGNELDTWVQGNFDGQMSLSTAVMVHEVGHAFNLLHAPKGGAANPQLNYPYQNAAIGTWGFDPVAMAAYDPATTDDMMSYSSTVHWVSDWDYLNALGFIGESQSAPETLAAADQYVVSGWIGQDQRPHLAPLVRVACAAHPPKAGDLELVLKTATGTRTIPFSAVQVPDLPAGRRHFAFTVPASTELLSARIQAPGTPRTLGPQGRVQARSLAARTQALAAAAASGSLVLRETPGNLHLAWDAQAHPYVNVLHEGATRTTLALHLQGGAADLSLAGLPPGGTFVVHYSDGLNTISRTLAR